jgi:hypothetical protein
MTPVGIGSEQPNANEMPRFAQNSGASGKVSESILCVDDDPHILAAFARQFRKTFTIETAVGPEEGLATIDKKGPFCGCRIGPEDARYERGSVSRGSSSTMA